MRKEANKKLTPDQIPSTQEVRPESVDGEISGTMTWQAMEKAIDSKNIEGLYKYFSDLKKERDEAIEDLAMAQDHADKAFDQRDTTFLLSEEALVKETKKGEAQLAEANVKIAVLMELISRRLKGVRDYYAQNQPALSYPIGFPQQVSDETLANIDSLINSIETIISNNLPKAAIDYMEEHEALLEEHECCTQTSLLGNRYYSRSVDHYHKASKLWQKVEDLLKGKEDD